MRRFAVILGCSICLAASSLAQAQERTNYVESQPRATSVPRNSASEQLMYRRSAVLAGERSVRMAAHRRVGRSVARPFSGNGNTTSLFPYLWSPYGGHFSPSWVGGGY